MSAFVLGEPRSLAAASLVEASPTAVSLARDVVSVSELRLSDGDVPQQTARRASVLLQMSGPVIVQVGLDGHYEPQSVGPGNFCTAPEGGPIAAARWRGDRHIVVAELSPVLLRSVAESHGLQSFELMSRQAIRDSRVSNLLLALQEEFASRNPSGFAYAEMIARAMTIRLLRAHAAVASERPQRGGLSRTALRRVVDYIEAHLDQDLRLRDLAGLSGLSEDHFARAFKESTGVPPHRYLLQRRLARARQLLETTRMPIVEIAQALGFTDQSHLTNLFRRHLGVTPATFREAES